MRLILVAGTTRTARVDGISAAGADQTLLGHTPSADAEILVYGRPTSAPVVPVSPTGCPTPATVTRAARDVLGFPVTVVDAGLVKPTAAPTVSLGVDSGEDIRTSAPVPAAPQIYESARQFGRSLPDSSVAIGETIPGGTTTALGVLRALGEEIDVSSSLPTNPLDRKEEIVETGLAASNLAMGDASGRPREAIRSMGDPVLAVAAGLADGVIETGGTLTLAGGTQMLAVAALLRHGGCDADLTIETTSFLAEDESVDLATAASRLDLSVTTTDPGFTSDHPAGGRYLAGEGKEGVGMGWAVTRASTAGALPQVRDRLTTIYDQLVDGSEADNAS